jgi:hypothetical protein
MRKIRRLGVCAVASLVLGMVAATVASAADYPLTELPELGRCVPSPSGDGGFIGPKCIAHQAKHKGQWEWLPGPEEGKFKEHLINPRFETVSGAKITCAFLIMEGEYTSGKTEKINPPITLQGCQDNAINAPCYSNGLEPGTIEGNVALTGELGFIPGGITAPWVGWDLKAENQATPIVTFTCGETSVEIEEKLAKFEELSPNNTVISFEGSVVGRVTKTNAMHPTFEIRYKQSKGIQIPTALNGHPEDVLKEISAPLAKPLQQTSEQVGLSSLKESENIENAERLEIKATQR